MRGEDNGGQIVELLVLCAREGRGGIVVNAIVSRSEDFEIVCAL